MNSIYSNLNEKKFKVLTIIFCFISDMFVLAHLKLSFGNEQDFQTSLGTALELMKKQNPDFASQMPPNFISELWQLMVMTLIGVACVYVLFHGVIYICHHYSKGFARGYIKFYAWSAGVLMALYAIVNITTPTKVMFLIPAALLIFVALGMDRFTDFKEKREV